MFYGVRMIREAAEWEARLAQLPAGVAERAKHLARTTQLTMKQATDRAIREHFAPRP